MITRRICLGAAALALIGGLAARHAWPAAAAARHDVRPPERLMDADLYVQGRPGEIDPRNRAFAPQYPLWTDGLTKRRWVDLPPGSTIDASDEYDWRFPIGTRFWKEFSYAGRRVETRLLWRTAEAGWVFASYMWNEDGSEAVLAPGEGVPRVLEVAPGRHHSIPSLTDCAACHGTTHAGPLGFTALQLSPDRDPDAIHGEPLTPDMLTLRTLLAEGRVTPDHASYAEPPRIRTSSAATRAVLGYLVANCSGCHDGRGEITAAAPTIGIRDLLTDGDAVVRSLVGQPTRWQIPDLPEGASVLVQPGIPDHSALLRRMRSRAPSSQMPPLGTVLRDDAAVDAITRWIQLELLRSH